MRYSMYIRDRKYGERRDTDFYLNLMTGWLAQSIVRAILERFGYRVFPYGIENYFSSIVREISEPSAGITGKQIRATPDLLVFDEDKKEAFFVEVKGTSGNNERRCYLRLDKLNAYRNYWEEAILVVYCFRSGNIYCKKVSQISGGDITKARDSKDVVLLNLEHDFSKLSDIFRRIDDAKYEEFRKEITKTIARVGGK